MTFITRPGQSAIKAEVAEGTEETIANTDVPCKTVDLDGNADATIVARKFKDPTLGDDEHIVGTEPASIDFKVELVAGGDATTPPAADKYLQALGLKQFTAKTVDLAGAPTGTFTPGEALLVAGAEVARFVEMQDTDTLVFVETGVGFSASDAITGDLSAATASVHATTPNETDVGFGYQPRTTGLPSFTHHAYLGREQSAGKTKRVRVIGGRGTGSIEVDEVGNILHLTGTIQGGGVEEDDIDFFATTPNELNVRPEPFRNNKVTVDGVDLVVNKFGFNLGNQVELRMASSAANGILSAYIVDRESVLSLDPEQTLESVHDWNAKFHGADSFSAVLGVGVTAGKRVKLLIPKGQYSALPKGERNGIGIYDANLAPRKQRGDDEYLLVFH